MATSDLIRPDFPPHVQDWIRAGNPVRSDRDSPLTGRCGAAVQRGNGETYCKLGAGWGTDHKGIGRCSRHSGVDQGLGLWVGELSKEQYGTVMNANPQPGVVQHGAAELADLTIEQIFERYLDPDEALIFQKIPTDPNHRIDFLIKMRSVALMRINKAIHGIRMQYAALGQHPPQDKIAGWEGLADRIAQTLARLEETKVKYRALESHNDHRRGLRELLSGLSAEEFAAVKSDPSLISAFHGAPPAGLLN